MKPPFKVHYDEPADVLYISGSDNRAAHGWERGDGVILRYAVDNNELVGVTIVDVKERKFPEPEK